MGYNNTKRIEYLDVAKGIGIILVVWAHSSGPFSKYIGAFHMPFFFLISGLLYKAALQTGDSRKYFMNKVKHLYIPFVFLNMLFYTLEALINHVDAKKVALVYLKILLTLAKEGKFMGATWFLAALFMVSCTYRLIDILLGEAKHKYAFVMCIYGLAMVLAINVTFKYMISRTIICAFYFAVGVFIKYEFSNTEYVSLNRSGTAAVCALFYLFSVYNTKSNLPKNTFDIPFLFIANAFLASYSVLYFSYYLSKKTVRVKKVLCYLGRRSIDIVIWHFTAFKLVIILQMNQANEKITISNVLQHYPIFSSKQGMWLVYLVTGLVLPLLFGSFYNHIKEELRQ